MPMPESLTVKELRDALKDMNDDAKVVFRFWENREEVLVAFYGVNFERKVDPNKLTLIGWGPGA